VSTICKVRTVLGWMEGSPYNWGILHRRMHVEKLSADGVLIYVACYEIHQACSSSLKTPCGKGLGESRSDNVGLTLLVTPASCARELEFGGDRKRDQMKRTFAKNIG